MIKELRKACAAIRKAEEADSVAGVMPRWVALPESVAEAAALMRVAAERDLAVVPVGGGTKLDWGRPPERVDILIDTCCLNEILEHEDGDLVARVQAGTPLETFAARLATKNQQLALDEPLAGATIGGTLATGLAGPRRLRYGTARDLLIGITVVLADGTVARSGGRVVKNVAGYDLGKLFTGSYGTLGLIVEATFRLHPIPSARAWVIATPDDVGEAAQAVLHSQTAPSAIEIDGRVISVLLEGAADAVAARAAAVRQLIGGQTSPEPPPWWGRLPSSATAELRFPPAALSQVYAATGGNVRGSAAGVMYGWGFRAERLTPYGCRVVPFTDGVASSGALTLMRRIKERFDPDRRLAPGRLAEGL